MRLKTIGIFWIFCLSVLSVTAAVDETAPEIELLEPQNQATVSLLLSGHKEWLSMPRRERVSKFKDMEGYRKRMKATGTRPAHVRLVWRCRHADGETCSGSYAVEVKKCRDGHLHYSVENLATNAIELVNLEIGEEYVWRVRCGEKVKRARFQTEDLAPRLLDWEGVPNVRDLGGWKTRDGRRVRQGLVFRSSGLNDNAHTFLSNEDVMKLYEAGQLEPLFGAKGKEIADKLDSGKMKPDDPALHKTFRCETFEKGKLRGTEESREYVRSFFGLRTDIDLRRTESECWGMTESPLGPNVAWLNLPGQSYGRLGTEKGKKGFKKAFDVFLDRARYGIVFHCIGGADRTGSLALILNGLLGVEEEDLWKDWEFTGFAGQTSYFVHKRTFFSLLKVFDAYPGDTLNDRIEAYVKSLGYTDEDIDKFRRLMLEERWQDELPRPVYDARPDFIELYQKAWELAHARIDEIPGLPSPRYMDEAHMSNRIWIWDTCFMAHFCKYCPGEFPGIESLDNFYGVMLADGDVPLPKVRGNVWCGKDEGKMLEFRIHHPDNPPLFAWTEYIYALQTGDRERLKKVYADKRWLQRWYTLFDAFDPNVQQPHGSFYPVMAKKEKLGYYWGGCPSGMDNTPRGRTRPTKLGETGLCPNNPDLLWLDALAQQGLSALSLSRIADLLGDEKGRDEWKARYEVIKGMLNTHYWDEQDGFYYDILNSTGEKVKVPTIASYWPLLAEMSSEEQARRLLAKLTDPNKFGGVMPAISIARDDPDFRADGSYWRGAMWLPTAYMAVKAADAYGDYATARETAFKIVDMMNRTYREFEPHTIWECYSPTEPKPARNKRGKYVRYDFCGWSALGPISLFLEDVIGIKRADAFANTLECAFAESPSGRVGVENYHFGKVVCSVVATKDEIRVQTNLPFTLLADGRQFAVRAGNNVFERRNHELLAR